MRGGPFTPERQNYSRNSRGKNSIAHLKTNAFPTKVLLAYMWMASAALALVDYGTAVSVLSGKLCRLLRKVTTLCQAY